MAAKISGAMMKRIRDGIELSIKEMRPFRQKRNKAINEFVGRWYAKTEVQEEALEVPINVMGWMVQTYLRLLVPHRAACMTRTVHPSQRVKAERLRLGMNYTLKEMRFGNTMSEVVTDGLFGLGAVKVGLTKACIRGFSDDSGQPFCDRISIDNLFFDHQARRFEEIQFCGDRYTVALEQLKGNRYYNQDVVKRLAANKGASQTDLDSALRVSRNVIDDSRRLKDMVDLWDVWLPYDGKLITLGGELDSASEPLRVVDWDGPENGPYHFLKYITVPDQIMPLSPIAELMDLHLVINAAARKLNNQLARQKDITAVNRGMESDGNTVKNARDGEVISINGDPSQIAHLRFGGPDAISQQYMMMLREVFKAHAGGLDILTGTSPMSDTLGQDRMLAAQASQQIADMQERTTEFVRDIMRSVAFYLMRQPGIDIMVSRDVGGMEMPARFRSEDFEDALEFDIDVSPYSMQNDTPASRIQSIQMVLQQVVFPLMPALEQQGKTVDPDATLRLIGKYLGLEDELAEIIVNLDPTLQQQMGPATEGGMKPAMTTRQYVRTNRPGASERGKADVMMRALSGVNSQGAERDQVGRATG